MAVIEIVVLAIWIMLPAYIPNNVAVIVGGGPPIDGGRTYKGTRLLGDGKTWRGTLGGILAGIIVAVVLTELAPTMSDLVGFDVPTFSVVAMLSLPTGALLGDIAASFIKRRLDRERGSAVPGLDQYDLVVGSLGLTAIVAWGWLSGVMTWWIFIAILILTPILHVSTNVIAYLLRLKDVPW